MSFEEAIQKEEERIEAGNDAILNGKEAYNYNHHVYGYLARGRYIEQLKRWLKYFNKDRLMVIKSEDFFESPEKNLEMIYRFLNIPVIFPTNLRIKNQGKYIPLNTETIKRLRRYYEPHNRQLRDLLGAHFQWN